MAEKLPLHVQRLLEMEVLRVCDAKLLFELRGLVKTGLFGLDQAVAVIARRQHGVVTRVQLLAIGMTNEAILGRLERGLLHRIHRGAYLVGNPSPAQFAHELAAVLACGKDSFLTGFSATSTYGMTKLKDGPREVLIVGRDAKRSDIKTRRTMRLDPLDHHTFHGIPIVSPARAIIEIAGGSTFDQLADAVEQGQIARLLTKPGLEQAMARAGRRPGVPMLRALLSELVFTRAKTERIVLGLIRAARLPTPTVNHPLDGDEIDFVFEELFVTLEVDGFKFHATRRAFERDRRRDADRQRKGHVVMRATYNELATQPHYFVARLAAVLALAEQQQRDRRATAA